MTKRLHGVDHDGNDTMIAGGVGDWMKRNWSKLAALAVWVTLLAVYWRYTTVNDLTPLQTVQQLVNFLAAHTLGIGVYILLYMLRPAIFFPATLLTLAGGYLYGPIFGTLIVVVASNLSAMVAYFIGRFFGTGSVIDASERGMLQRYANRMRHNSFETVLVMRFIFLPYDLVSYFSGFLRVHWRGFLLATALGSIPGTISFVLFGAAIDGQFTGDLPSLDPVALGIAAVMFVVSIVLSRWFRRREAQRETVVQA